MGAQTNSLQEALSRLEEHYNLTPGSRRAKCKALYELAMQAKGGCILELGTYHGLGAVAMMMGTENGNNLIVCTIDDYIDKRGWANEQYLLSDMDVYEKTCEKIGYEPTLIVRDAIKVVDDWMQPVSLLFWDLGVPAKDFAADMFLKWDKHIVVGGVYAIHDLVSQTLGSKEVFDIALATGRYSEHKQYLDCGIFTLKKESYA